MEIRIITRMYVGGEYVKPSGCVGKKRHRRVGEDKGAAYMKVNRPWGEPGQRPGRTGPQPFPASDKKQKKPGGAPTSAPPEFCSHPRTTGYDGSRCFSGISGGIRAGYLRTRGEASASVGQGRSHRKGLGLETRARTANASFLCLPSHISFMLMPSIFGPCPVYVSPEAWFSRSPHTIHRHRPSALTEQRDQP